MEDIADAEDSDVRHQGKETSLDCVVFFSVTTRRCVWFSAPVWAIHFWILCGGEGSFTTLWLMSPPFIRPSLPAVIWADWLVDWLIAALVIMPLDTLIKAPPPAVALETVGLPIISPKHSIKCFFMLSEFTRRVLFHTPSTSFLIVLSFPFFFLFPFFAPSVLPYIHLFYFHSFHSFLFFSLPFAPHFIFIFLPSFFFSITNIRCILPFRIFFSNILRLSVPLFYFHPSFPYSIELYYSSFTWFTPSFLSLRRPFYLLGETRSTIMKQWKSMGKKSLFCHHCCIFL